MSIVEKYSKEIDEIVEDDKKGYFSDYEDTFADRMSDAYRYLYKFGICDGVTILNKGIQRLGNSNISKETEITKEIIEKVINDRTEIILKKLINIVDFKKYDVKLNEIEKNINKDCQESSILESFKRMKHILIQKENTYWKLVYKYGVYEILKIVNRCESEANLNNF